MILGRAVSPELLDELAPDQPEAMRSRRDLQRVNVWMRQSSIMAGLLRSHRVLRLLDVGAGDGTFTLSVCKRLKSSLPVEVTLLDRQLLLTADLQSNFTKVNCKGKAVSQDVFEYLHSAEKFDVIIANLFLHHFEGERLAELLSLIARRTDLFAACEPRRSKLALLGSRSLGLIGCNHVTRHDAQVSVRAGFINKEISALWPSRNSWQLEEGEAGPFSHVFKAVRKP